MAVVTLGAMLMTKLGHSCVRLEKDGARLVIDPGVWSGPDVLAGANAVLVTHEHADHLDPAAVRAALAADPGLQLWANGTVAGQLAEFGGQVHAVRHGDTVTAAGFEVRVYGTDHAIIDVAIPVIRNTGFAVDGQVFHPGDSFTVPGQRVPVLLVPVTAPWLKFGEVADYIRTVAPERGYWIHDALLNDKGASLIENLVKIAPASSGPASYLAPGTSVEL
jgi:L-ascorbate metabolism protein UlaG (beta-lactamase superfamily)